VVIDVSAAKERPELSVLSAMAHGRTEVGLDVATAALAAIVGVADAERKALYGDLVLSSVDEATRKTLEALMTIPNYEHKSEFARTYIAKGLVEGERRPLVHLFERRLARSLSSEERDRLAERLNKEGAERLTDMALDLSPEALAAWLGMKT